MGGEHLALRMMPGSCDTTWEAVLCKLERAEHYLVILRLRHLHTPVFTAALFIIAKIRKQPKCPSVMNG